VYINIKFAPHREHSVLPLEDHSTEAMYRINGCLLQESYWTHTYIHTYVHTQWAKWRQFNVKLGCA